MCALKKKKKKVLLCLRVSLCTIQISQASHLPLPFWETRVSPRPSLSARGSQCPGYCQLEAVGGCLGVCPRQGWCLPAHTPFSHGPFDISWFFLWPPTGQGRAPLLEVPVSSTWPDPGCMHQARNLGLRMGHLGGGTGLQVQRAQGGQGEASEGRGLPAFPGPGGRGCQLTLSHALRVLRVRSGPWPHPRELPGPDFPRSLVGPACSGPCWTPVWPGKAHPTPPPPPQLENPVLCLLARLGLCTPGRPEGRAQ